MGVFSRQRNEETADKKLTITQLKEKILNCLESSKLFVMVTTLLPLK